MREVDRWEWRPGDGGDLAAGLRGFLTEHGLAAPPARQTGRTAVALLVGAAGCARLAGLPEGRRSPVPAVPEVAAVALRWSDRVPATVVPPATGTASTIGPWTTTWTDAEHAAAAERVRAVIAEGGVYQANVVGHRWAAHRDRPTVLAARVAALPGASYGGLLAGDGWAVGCASPEQLVAVSGQRITTVPVKGTRPVGPGGAAALRGSPKERAEHVMIVDLERNDLSRVAVTGSVDVESLFELSEWSGLWHAGSRIAARLRDDADVLDVLAAMLPGGSVTGAPKRAACGLLAELEPVGRGPSMGALGLLWPGGLDLGLTIRTVAVTEDEVHVWAGGGITWGSVAADEVAEAHAKAAPVLAALAG